MKDHDVCILLTTCPRSDEDATMMQAGTGMVVHLETEHAARPGDTAIDIASVSLDNPDGMAKLASAMGALGVKEKHLAELVGMATKPGCPMLVIAYAPTPKARLVN